MKCPHCGVAIHEAFVESQPVNQPPIKKDGKQVAPQLLWDCYFLRCPECYESIVFLLEFKVGPGPGAKFMAYPKGYARPVAQEVVDPYKADFIEACKVIGDSPKASAALSRRCMQAVLKDKGGAKKKDLADQIDEVIGSGVPSYIAEGLHAVRNIGNFAAHPLKSTNTGEIVEVEPNEAEWNLEVVELLFDFYFVQPATLAKRKAELNKKLKDAGKPELP
jgi:hypothetical protein